MSETERFPRPPASEGSRSPVEELPAGDADLAPAFSLTSSPVPSTRNGKFGHSLFSSSHSLSGANVPTRQPGATPSFPSSGPPDQASPDPEGDELLDLFSVLGLDGKSQRTASLFGPPRPNTPIKPRIVSGPSDQAPE